MTISISSFEDGKRYTVQIIGQSLIYDDYKWTLIDPVPELYPGRRLRLELQSPHCEDGQFAIDGVIMSVN